MGLQCGWTISFSYEIMWLSLIFMYGILTTLIAASMSLQRYEKTIKGYLLWQGPFPIQTGWIMAAAGVMTNTLPVCYEASAMVRIIVASLTLAVLTVTALSWLSSYPVDFAIPLVIVWALGGVYAELNEPMDVILTTFTMKQINGIHSGVLAGLCLIGGSIILKVLYVLFKQRPNAIKNKQEQHEQHQQEHKEKENPSSSSSNTSNNDEAV